ncbi:MAG: plasmid stabilization protein [Clostridium chrysemydis]|uniref:plasmid stabilization protein n=1 Tax=Clostridium chrysemydis TaxID=2665504 RepID=UPI003F3F6A85
MEKEILEILKSMQQELKGLKDEQQKANEKLDRIEKKIDITYDQVARSAEDITSIKNDLCFVEEATAKNWNDIAKLKAVK